MALRRRWKCIQAYMVHYVLFGTQDAIQISVSCPPRHRINPCVAIMCCVWIRAQSYACNMMRSSPLCKENESVPVR